MCSMCNNPQCEGHPDSTWNQLRHAHDQSHAAAVEWFQGADIIEKTILMGAIEVLKLDPVTQRIGALAHLALQNLSLAVQDRVEQDSEASK